MSVTVEQHKPLDAKGGDPSPEIRLNVLLRAPEPITDVALDTLGITFSRDTPLGKMYTSVRLTDGRNQLPAIRISESPDTDHVAVAYSIVVTPEDEKRATAEKDNCQAEPNGGKLLADAKRAVNVLRAFEALPIELRAGFPEIYLAEWADTSISGLTARCVTRDCEGAEETAKFITGKTQWEILGYIKRVLDGIVDVTDLYEGAEPQTRPARRLWLVWTKRL